MCLFNEGFAGATMRHKTEEERELERQEMLKSMRKTQEDLQRRIQDLRRKEKAEKLLRKYETRQDNG